MGELTIGGERQTEVVKACKHLLAMARSGKLAAIGYVVVEIEDDLSIQAGTNAVWNDQWEVREALRAGMDNLKDRASAQLGAIIHG